MKEGTTRSLPQLSFRVHPSYNSISSSTLAGTERILNQTNLTFVIQ